MGFIIALLIIWLALPLGLIPAVIVLARKNAKLRKLIEAGADYSPSKLPVKDRKPLSFTVILIIGVLFVIIAGILFATSAWEYMSGGLRTVLIISLSAVFFAASFVSDRKLGLDKTGFAFFVLGGIFLPVSVLGVAYFELFGKAFSVESADSRYIVFAVMLIVTFAVTVLSQLRYRESKLIRYIFSAFSAAEYAAFSLSVSEYVNGEDFGDVRLMAFLLAAGYLLFTLIPALRSVPAQTGMIFALAGCSLDGDKGAVTAAVAALFCTVVTIVINRKIYSTSAIIVLPPVVYNLINTVVTADIGYAGDLDYAVIICTMAVLGAVSMILGLMFSKENKEAPENSSEAVPEWKLKVKWIERVTGFSVFLLSFYGFSELDCGHEERYPLAFGGLTVLYFAAKAFTLWLGGKDTDFRHALMFACVTASLTLMQITPPDIIENEYYTMATLAVTVPLMFIWKKRRAFSETILFVHSCIAMLILMINALDQGELINSVIIAGIAALMLVISFMRREKKWFVLSAASSVIIVLQLTQDIWTSVSWWVYLLAVGLIFISYAAVNEYCRKKGQDNPVKLGFRKIIDDVWNRC